MFSQLPDELISRIALDAIILLKNTLWKELHEELLLQRVTPQTEFGSIFLTRSYPTMGVAALELADVEYIHAERLPELI